MIMKMRKARKIWVCLVIVIICTSCGNISAQDYMKERIEGVLQHQPYEVVSNQNLADLVLTMTKSGTELQLHQFRKDRNGIRYEFSYPITPDEITVFYSEIENEMVAIVAGSNSGQNVTSYELDIENFDQQGHGEIHKDVHEFAYILDVHILPGQANTVLHCYNAHGEDILMGGAE